MYTPLVIIVMSSWVSFWLVSDSPDILPALAIVTLCPDQDGAGPGDPGPHRPRLHHRARRGNRRLRLRGRRQAQHQRLDHRPRHVRSRAVSRYNAALVSRYVMLCFSMVFLAFVEFAFISFIGIFVKRLKLNDLVRVTTLRQMTRCTGGLS